MSPPIAFLTLCTALGSGLVAGVFFAFSTFVMPALSRLPPEQGVAAMQAINVAAINRWFMGAFLGTAAACLILAAASLIGWRGPGAGLRLGGSALYLAGAFLVTIAFHVPRNDALAALPSASPEAAGQWLRYLSEWTRWNHLRTAAALLSALLLTASLTGWWRSPP